MELDTETEKNLRLPFEYHCSSHSKLTHEVRVVDSETPQVISWKILTDSCPKLHKLIELFEAGE